MRWSGAANWNQIGDWPKAREPLGRDRHCKKHRHKSRAAARAQLRQMASRAGEGLDIEGLHTYECTDGCPPGTWHVARGRRDKGQEK